jgi:Cof subfamily protein (haloacid dehalogenase superfamily)
MIRLIAIDLDGTLFNSQQQISASSKSAFRRIINSGIQTVIVTGRGKAGAEMALDMLGLDMPYICSAGSLVSSGKNGTVISARTFLIHEELIRIIEFTRQNNAGLIADSLAGNWWFGPDELGESLDPLTAAYAWKSQRTRNPEKDFFQPLLKITLVADPDILNLAENQLCNHCPSIHHIYAGMRYMDLTSRDVNKGTALEILAKYLKIQSRDIAAIGDQPIDLPMLALAGLPIAMDNAPDSLKKAASWIAPSNDKDGVAWALNKILSDKP